MDFEVSRTNYVSTKETHYATATVGRDTIENVEYITFDHSDWWKPKEIKTFKDVLEKIWDVITTPYYFVKRNVRDVYWKIYYGFERMFKDYDSIDTFATFDKFIERYSKVLKELREHHMGYPMQLSEEEWDNILDEMLYHLHYMKEETVVEELERNVPDDWSASYKTVYEVLDKHKNEFFKLFSEYFYNLWD